ncbi:GNAT family N-acetyltransferase [Brachybacterium phenoliresistens]|uniref:GNAT family N-acetyltransferase n=1 Tax=Brachybacterium phenoliresistens TaxID=396014 RepID=UPI0031D47C0D
MNLTVRPLDLASDADIAQVNALDEACDRALFGGEERFTVAQSRARLQPSPYWERGHWAAVLESLEGGESIVGYAAITVPLAENLDQVFVDLSVHPAHRGGGIGTALVREALVPAIRETGRPVVAAWGSIPADGDPDDPQLPANRLASTFGLARKNVAVCRVLDLPLRPELLDELAAQAAEKIGEYRVLAFEDEIPEEHLAAYGVLLHQLDLDDPDEDLEYEAADYTPERIRIAEQRRRDAGTREIIAVAVAPDGSFAGNSVVDFHAGEGTTLGWQENTLVMPEHRGHRLGLALKVATHRRLAAEAPHLDRIATWNSHVNPWMIAINEQLGYRISHREVAFQGRPAL